MKEVFNTIQALFDQWVSIEKPRRDVFYSQLLSLIRLVHEGQITRKDFFDRLMKEGDGRAVSALVQINRDGCIKNYFVGRTDDRKLKIEGDDGVTVQIGLDNEGQLKVEKLVAVGVTDEPYKIEDEATWIDQTDETWQQSGEFMLEGLIYQLVPFETPDSTKS